MIDKKEIKKSYKLTMTPMGVYQIKNLVNRKIFVGSSKNISGRINRHKFQLQFGGEEIKELMDDYRKFGAENFSFETLDQLKPKDEPGYDYSEDLEVLRELWMEKLQPFGERGYNKKD